MISQEGVALEIDTFSNDKNRSRLQWISDGLGEKDTQGGADRIILLESDVLDLLLVYHQALRNTRKKNISVHMLNLVVSSSVKVEGHFVHKLATVENFSSTKPFANYMESTRFENSVSI